MTDAPTRLARCHCGKLTLQCTAAPRKISICHCLECQRRTGSAFSVAAFYERTRVLLPAAETGRFERPSASGFPVLFHFCRQCGSNVFWEPRRMPDLVGVALGAFADPRFPPPTQAVWMKERHSWVALPDGIAMFDEGTSGDTRTVPS